MSSIGPTIEETLTFIIQAHGEQTRRGEMIPYYTHPVAVAKIADAICEALKVSEYIRYNVNRTSLLHDVVEDTPVTIKMLGKMGYPVDVLDSTYLLTKDVEILQTHNQNVDEIILSEDLVALISKAADTYHNSIITPEDALWCAANKVDAESLHKRYMRSFAKLMTKIMEMYNRGDWVVEKESKVGTIDNAMSEMVQAILKTDPHLKNLLHVVASTESSE